MNAGDDDTDGSRALKLALSTFVIWRGALLAFDYVGIHLVPMMGTCRPQWEPFGPGHDFWNGFFRWDAGFYKFIALNGYKYHGGYSTSVAFYPLYPYLCRWLGLLIGSPFVAGLLLSNAATVAGIYYLLRLGTLLFDRATAERAAVLVLVFPTSLFLSAFYTEGLFFGLSTASMYAFYRRRYATSGALGALAMMTRSTGIVLFGALAAELVLGVVRRQTRFRWPMLGLLLIPLGLVAFMVILQYEVGDPLAFVKAEASWGWVRSWPWAGIVDAFAKLTPGLPRRLEDTQSVLDAITALGFLAIGVAMAARGMPVALWAMVLGGVLLPLSMYNRSSTGRYTLVLFPAYFWLSAMCVRFPRLERWMLFASAFFLAIYSLRFMRCGFAG